MQALKEAVFEIPYKDLEFEIATNAWKLVKEWDQNLMLVVGYWIPGDALTSTITIRCEGARHITVGRILGASAESLVRVVMLVVPWNFKELEELLKNGNDDYTRLWACLLMRFAFESIPKDELNLR